MKSKIVVSVVSGDVARVKADALITAINSGGMWFGGIDGVINRCPLHQVIYDGLKAASDAGFKSVSLPTIRMGVMLGVVEKSADEAVAEMVKGVKKFLVLEGHSLQNITFVVYNDKKVQSLLQDNLPK